MCVFCVSHRDIGILKKREINTSKCVLRDLTQNSQNTQNPTSLYAEPAKSNALPKRGDEMNPATRKQSDLFEHRERQRSWPTPEAPDLQRPTRRIRVRVHRHQAAELLAALEMFRPAPKSQPACCKQNQCETCSACPLKAEISREIATETTPAAPETLEPEAERGGYGQFRARSANPCHPVLNKGLPRFYTPPAPITPPDAPYTEPGTAQHHEVSE
jgi:hypothetical protein